ncbi:MAG: nuclear transport factor 2 family protein [Kiloniellales bacterium]
MRRLFLSTILVVLSLGPFAQAEEAPLRDQILEAYQAITEAFELQDSSAIEALTTADHIAITPYYGGAKPIAFQLTWASELIFTQRPISPLIVEAVGEDVAVLRFKAEMEGSFRGKPLPKKAAITLIWQKVDGTWLERLYQETPIE